MDRSLLKQLLLPPAATIAQAMDRMSRPPKAAFVLVIDENRRLRGIVVDYDIRKALVAGQQLDAPLSDMMNPHPTTLPASISPEGMYAFFCENNVNFVPILDPERRVVDVAVRNEVLSNRDQSPNWVVIMAGGKGMRLRPLTQDCPKPLLTIGDKPLLETIIEQFLELGFSHFMISVNYLADHIEEYFQDGLSWGATIHYLQETKPLGTAGALALIKEKVERPFVVMNGDLLTGVNYRSVLDFHVASGNVATMCVREHQMEVPFGVVRSRGVHLVDILEKPSYSFLINAGIYVFDPEVLRYIPKHRQMDMVTLIRRIKQKSVRPVGCFPIHEYWRDIGCHKDHAEALDDFSNVVQLRYSQEM